MNCQDPNKDFQETDFPDFSFKKTIHLHLCTLDLEEDEENKTLTEQDQIWLIF